MSEERTVLGTVALARLDHHHLFDDDAWLPGTLELDRLGAGVGRSTALVTPAADAAVLELQRFNALALAVLDSSTDVVSPGASTATTRAARLHAPQTYIKYSLDFLTSNQNNRSV